MGWSEERVRASPEAVGRRAVREPDRETIGRGHPQRRHRQSTPPRSGGPRHAIASGQAPGPDCAAAHYWADSAASAAGFDHAERGHSRPRAVETRGRQTGQRADLERANVQIPDRRPDRRRFRVLRPRLRRRSVLSRSRPLGLSAKSGAETPPERAGRTPAHAATGGHVTSTPRDMKLRGSATGRAFVLPYSQTSNPLQFVATKSFQSVANTIGSDCRQAARRRSRVKHA